MYTDDDKPEMTMPKQIDVKVTKPQNKNLYGQGKTRKCPTEKIKIEGNNYEIYSSKCFW